MNKLLTVFFCALVGIGVSAVHASAKTDWQELVSAENMGKDSVFERWCVIQPILLYAKRPGLNVEYSALAAIHAQLNRYTVSPSEDIFAYNATQDPMVLRKKRADAYVAFYNQNVTESVKYRNALEDTAGSVSDGMVSVQLLSKLSPSPRRAAELYAKNNYLQYKATTGGLDRGMCKLLLDAGNPFIVKVSEHCFLCIGYAEGKEKDLALLVDIEKVKTVRRDLKEFPANLNEIEDRLLRDDVARSRTKKMPFLVRDEEFWLNGGVAPDYVALVPWPEQAEIYAICLPSPSYPLVEAFCKSVTLTAEEQMHEQAREEREALSMLNNQVWANRLSKVEAQAMGERVLGQHRYERAVARVQQEEADARRKMDEIRRIAAEKERVEHEKWAAEASKNRAEEARYLEDRAKRVKAAIEERRRELARPEAVEAVKMSKAMRKMCAAEKKGLAAQEKNTPEAKREEAAARKEYEDAFKEYDVVQWESYMKEKQELQKQQERQEKKQP